jgi:hypothetical protein
MMDDGRQVTATTVTGTADVLCGRSGERWAAVGSVSPCVHCGTCIVASFDRLLPGANRRHFPNSLPSLVMFSATGRPFPSLAVCELSASCLHVPICAGARNARM